MSDASEPLHVRMGDLPADELGGSAPQSTRDGDGSQSTARDLVYRVTGLYRILDLISEQGSGGLGKSHLAHISYKSSGPHGISVVDKVVIAQEHLGRLMNNISPGVYSSMTKVDFTAFDKVSVKPLGIYGSKSEIIRFLISINVVDAETYVHRSMLVSFLF